jgi:hypothetical protein
MRVAIPIATKSLIWAALLCAVAPPLSAQVGNQACKDMEYEHRNQLDNVPYRIRQVKGTASDQEGFAIPGICIGIFTETEHKLVATAETNEKGVYELKNLPAGDYRPVAHYNGLCPANVRLRIQPRLRSKKVLALHMVGPAIDSCSYGELTKPKRSGSKPASSAPLVAHP